MFKTLKEKIVYENKWIRLHEDEVEFSDGSKGVYAFTERVDAGSMILPLTNEGEIIFLREWRYPIQNWTYCFPFGGRDEHETFLQTAQRELQEETGFVANDWIDLGILQIDPGANSQTTPVFLARGLTQTGLIEKEVSEIHEVCVFSVEEVDEMIVKGEITNGWFLAGYMKLRVYLEKEKIKK
jgi:ADP-ribose pyrophosphatase